MKLCTVCGQIFDNDKYEFCPYCGNNLLLKTTEIKLSHENGAIKMIALFK